MHIYKKVLPAAVAMALAACGGGSDSFEDQTAGGTPAGTYPKFNPVTSDLPLNTDLVFAAAATSDGTANVGVATNPVESAINVLDGFSTNAYFDIAFDGGSIDPASVCALGTCEGVPNVFVMALDTSGGDGDALNPANVIGIQGAAAVSTSVVSLDGGTDNVLRIAPLQPLDAKTKYLVFVTNSVLDANGDPIKASSSYNILGENEPALSASLQAARGAVQGWETLASLVLLGGPSEDPLAVQAAKDSIAISYTFTTTDPIAPLVGMAAPRAALAGLGVPSENVNGLQAGGLLSTPEASDLVGVPAATGQDIGALTGLAVDVATLYTGYIQLPYYLTTPETTASASYTQDSWVPDATLAANLGMSVPADVDGSTNVTYRYPFATQQSLETVPLQVTLPDPAYEVATGVTCSDANPGGLPVVIYVHGITSDRSSVVALAHSLAGACLATVAIDLPLHGVTNNTESPLYGLNVENPAGLGAAFAGLGDDAPRERHFNDAAGSGGQFINLQVLQNTRDNLRQSVMDLLNLNASLDAISANLEAQMLSGLDTTNVKVVGVSLGGVVGTVYATVNQLAYGADSAAMFASNLHPLNGVVSSSAGGQLTQVLANSLALGPTVNGGLAQAGVNQGTSDYEKFLYAAQSTIDSGDPVNFASTLSALGVPVMVQQIVGGGDASGLGDTKVYTADKVIPNSVEGAPLAGTTPLAALAGASLPGSAPGAASANLLINLAIGHHASLLRPSEDGVTVATNGETLATGELQTEVVTFVLDSANIAVGTAGSNAAAAFIETSAP